MPDGVWTQQYFDYDKIGRLSGAYRAATCTHRGMDTIGGGPDYSYTYDTLDRLRRIDKPLGAVVSAKFAGDRAVTVTDARGYTSQYVLSKHGQVTSVERTGGFPGATYLERTLYS